MNRPLRVAIVGGGVSGLTVAYRLEQANENSPGDREQLEIDLFESSERLGGKIHSVRVDEMLMEMGAESFLSRKQAGVELCKELGLLETMRGTRPENKKTFVWQDGKMHRLPSGLTGFVPGNIKSLFSTSLLSLSGKLRVAADLFIPASRSTEDESLESFITRRLGRQAYRRLIQPLLCGIYAGDGNQLSVQATYPELRGLEKKFGSVIRGLRKRQQAQKKSATNQQTEPLPPFVTFKGGMSELIEALQSKLQRTRIELSQQVQSAVRVGEKWSLDFQSGDSREYDAVVLTCPAFAAAEIIGSAAPDLAQQLNRIPHVSTAAINLWYAADEMEHSLDGYGFVVPADEQDGVTAVTWTSPKHYDRCPEGRKLIRAYLGRAGAEVGSETSDDEIFAIAKREIKRFMKVQVSPLDYRIQRWPAGAPQYALGHPEILLGIDSQLENLGGLFLTGASYRGVGIPDCIRLANSTAENVGGFLSTG